MASATALSNCVMKSALKARLLGTKEFPIRIGLKPPSGSSAILNMDHFQKFVKEWKSFHHQGLVQWSVKSYRDLSEQVIPTFVVIDSTFSPILFPHIITENQNGRNLPFSNSLENRSGRCSV